jgi:hypothetical protein
VTFSLIHPSIRPDKWREIYDAWLKAAAHPEAVQYILAPDTKWFGELSSGDRGLRQLQEWADWNALRGWINGHSANRIEWQAHTSYVAAVNEAARSAIGDVLIVIADDLWPAEGWDEVLTARIKEINVEIRRTELEGGFPWLEGSIEPARAGEFAIWVNNGDRHIGSRGDIMAMPVVSRSRIERLEYLYYPAYLSMDADLDLAEHCQMDAAEGRCSLILLNEPVFPHKHPTNDRTVPVDEAYRWQNRPEAYAIGRRVLEARRAAKFGDVKIETPRQIPKRRIAVCVAGQSFSLPWVARWSELLQLGQYHDMNIVFAGGITNVYHMRIGMARNVLSLEPPWDYVLWLDDDQLASIEDVNRLIADLEEHPEIDLVAGWTVCGVDSYQTAPQLSFGLEEGKIATAADLAPGALQEVLYTGFALVLMRYELLKDLGSDAFWPYDRDAKPTKLPVGEDVSFCYRARGAGRKVYIDRRVGPLPHMKLADIAVGTVLGTANASPTEAQWPAGSKK